MVCLLPVGIFNHVVSFKIFVSSVSVACLQTGYHEAKCMTTIKKQHLHFFFLHFRDDLFAEVDQDRIRLVTNEGHQLETFTGDL